MRRGYSCGRTVGQNTVSQTGMPRSGWQPSQIHSKSTQRPDTNPREYFSSYPVTGRRGGDFPIIVRGCLLKTKTFSCSPMLHRRFPQFSISMLNLLPDSLQFPNANRLRTRTFERLNNDAVDEPRSLSDRSDAPLFRPMHQDFPSTSQDLIRALKSPTDPPTGHAFSKIQMASQAWSQFTCYFPSKDQVIADWILTRFLKEKDKPRYLTSNSTSFCLQLSGSR